MVPLLMDVQSPDSLELSKEEATLGGVEVLPSTEEETPCIIITRVLDALKPQEEVAEVGQWQRWVE